MNTQRRRLDANTDQKTVGGQAQVTIEQNETDAANMHGMHYCFSIEPENGDANANGFWIVYCLPAGVIDQAVGTDLPSSFSDLDNEDFLPYVWGVGCWTASNQAPFHYEFAPRTSRNCQKGARIVGVVSVSGISAGLVRINSTMTCFQSS